MPSNRDAFLTPAELSQEYPNMKIVGGQKPTIQLVNCTLRKALDYANKRAFDTGLDVRVIGAGGRVLAQADGA